MLPVILFSVLGIFALGAATANRRKEDEQMGAVTPWMGGRGPGAGSGAVSWMGSRSPSQPYAWDEPSSLVANWTRNGDFYGEIHEMKHGFVNEFPGIRLFWASSLDHSFWLAKWPDEEWNWPVGGGGPGGPTYFYKGESTRGIPKREDEKPLALKDVEVFVYPPSWSWDKAIKRARMVLPGGVAFGSLEKEIEDEVEEEFGIKILGFNIPLTPGERLENLDRKIEKAQDKKHEYEKEAAEEGADLAYLARKIARLDQMVDKWEEKKEKVESRLSGLPADDYGYFHRIMPNLTPAFGAEEDLDGAFWEEDASVKDAQMDSVPLFEKDIEDEFEYF
jgi:hypothetical protein